jgi:cyanophycinase
LNASGLNRGRLFLIGGNEDKQEQCSVLAEVVQTAGGAGCNVCVLTTASSIPQEIGELYNRVFKTLGCGAVEIMHVQDRPGANDKGLAQQLSEADCIFLTGGDQLKITSVLANTAVGNAVRRAYFDGGRLVAGTSAGASCVSNPMVYLGEGVDAFEKGSIKFTMGLDLLGNTVVDTHFIERGRFGRLIQAVAANPSTLGIGVGEDTGILISPELELVVHGSGSVVVVDGSQIIHNSIADAEPGQPIAVEGLTVHILAARSRFDLKARVMLRMI